MNYIISQFAPMVTLRNKMNQLPPCISKQQIKILLRNADALGIGLCASTIRYLQSKYWDDYCIMRSIWLIVHLHFQLHNAAFMVQWTNEFEQEQKCCLSFFYREILTKSIFSHGSHLSLHKYDLSSYAQAIPVLQYILREDVQEAIYAFSKFPIKIEEYICLFELLLKVRTYSEEEWLRVYSTHPFNEHEVAGIVVVCIKFQRWKIFHFLKQGLFGTRIFTYAAVIKACVKYHCISLLQEISRENEKICALVMHYSIRYYREEGDKDLDNLLHVIFNKINVEIPDALRGYKRYEDSPIIWIPYTRYAIVKSNMLMLRYFIEKKRVNPNTVFDTAADARDWEAMRYLETRGARIWGQCMDYWLVTNISPFLLSYLQKKSMRHKHKQKFAYANKRWKKSPRVKRTKSNKRKI